MSGPTNRSRSAQPCHSLSICGLAFCGVTAATTTPFPSHPRSRRFSRPQRHSQVKLASRVFSHGARSGTICPSRPMSFATPPTHSQRVTGLFGKRSYHCYATRTRQRPAPTLLDAAVARRNQQRTTPGCVTTPESGCAGIRRGIGRDVGLALLRHPERGAGDDVRVGEGDRQRRGEPVRLTLFSTWKCRCGTHWV